jgi:hypothetical protein
MIMDREIKMVPIDFSWPMGKVWYGYMISHCLDGQHDCTCEDCKMFAKIKGLEIASHGCPVFENLEPPEGDGFQMWETCSEGSPMSPVFKTPEELAKWLFDNSASSFGSQTASYDEWLTMITTSGYDVSAVLDVGNNTIKSGVAAISETAI